MANFMSMRFHILFVIASIFLSNCAPSLHIVERYPNNKEKTVELMRGKGSSRQIIKRIEYYSNGRKKSEVDINNARKDGKYLCLLYTSPSPRDLSTSRMPSSA